MGRHAAALLVSLLVGPFATLPWSGDDAIAALRARLRHRGYAAQVTAGPMVALWSDDAPSHPLTSHPAMPARLSGAYLVYTDAGGWWMWPNGLDSGPQLAHQTIPE